LIERALPRLIDHRAEYYKIELQRSKELPISGFIQGADCGREHLPPEQIDEQVSANNTMHVI
jgi:hypothetical protein